MLKEHWDELEAQVESHGPEAVVFIDRGLKFLEITNVQLVDDGVIEVTLE